MDSHFAQIDESGRVLNVIVATDEMIALMPDAKRFIQTYPEADSQTGFNYAVIGGLYRADDAVFIDPQPYKSWVLDEITFTWRPPIEPPTDGHLYHWDESSRSWAKLGTEQPTNYLPPEGGFFIGVNNDN